ncbi:hypothetical protein ES332_D13G191400v1 [Gossypium tomentosum]|uniref:tyrosine--tRNA ligase n=1 Tax=Gossypium tomentosum TaxID=34277 RepID=A0A5D2I0J9_GOSTO|nr:hypothetical protein ES332_D13G191400v1 [Gossypium tomentosum]
MADQSPADQTPPSSGMQMSLEEKFKIIRSVGEECIQEDELLNLLNHKPEPICYDGFEPSDRTHIAQSSYIDFSIDVGIESQNSINSLMDLIYTEKLIMDLLCFFLNVEFLWSSDEINSRASEYWPLVMDIARRNKLPKIMRLILLLTPNTKCFFLGVVKLWAVCADIFFLNADIFQLGMDQRKVNVLAREYCDDIKRKNKQIILSHRIVLLQYLFWFLRSIECGEKLCRFKSLTKTNYFEMLEELDISDNQIRVLPESFRLLSKLRVLRADETPLKVPPREVIKLGAQVILIWLQI